MEHLMQFVMYLGPDDNVLDKSGHSLVDTHPQDVIDHTLEYYRCIAESEWHDSIFEEAISALECHLTVVFLLDSDEVVFVLRVDFVEEFRTANSFLKLLHIGETLTIGDD